MIQDIVKTLNCVGCGACAEICSRRAIKLSSNIEGFLYPIVNEELCILCGFCKKVCPALHSDNIKQTEKGEAYAVINRNLEVLKQSSSGGVFSAIAEYIFQQGGVVYGAAFDSNLILAHKKIDNIQALQELRGSKYLQSNIQKSFKEIKSILQDNKWVYFVGTSCQVAALKLFLRKEYDKLLTSDLVCHGVPSQKIFHLFVNEFERKNECKILQYNFRDKKVNGWSCSSSSAYVKENKTGKHKYVGFDKILNSYFSAFISGAINRECCYKCMYTTEERVSDITLADFWGVEEYHKNLNISDGVSFISVNTDKGRYVFDRIKDSLTIENSQYEYAEKINKCLYQSTRRPQLRDTIYNEIDVNV